jgi:hypothetical protein
MLQLRLQPMLSDVIFPQQSTSLPLRFIFDNVVLTQEAVHWPKALREPLVFFY